VNGVRALLAIARADFLDRVRRYSFLVTLAATAWLGWLVVQGRVTLRLGPYAGIVNAPWAGALVAVTISALVSLAGFWIVKSAVRRDRDTRVGEILAATPMSKPLYTVGKCLSNFAVLATIVAVLAVAAPVLVALGGGAMDVVGMLSPFVLIALPSMAVVAALAVLFETVRPLSGGVGNVLWFFVWSFLLAFPMITHSPRADLSGLMVLQRSMGDTVRAAHPDYGNDFSLSIGGPDDPVSTTFEWNGVRWTGDAVLERVTWFGIAVVIALIAALPFDRFDESRRGKGALPFSAGKRRPERVSRAGDASALIPSFLPTVFAGELKLMLNGRPWWYWAVFVGLIVAGAATPIGVSRGTILPFAWIWPILIWSAMGAREARDGTEELVFTAPRPLMRQLPSTYFAGVAVALAAGSGVALKCVTTGSFAALGGLSAGALFVPAMALCLGTWSGGSKLFEAVYTVVWYVGPMQHVPALDFMGASDAALAARMPVVFAVAALALFGGAVAGRRFQMVR
jgi:hypothetical protein